MHIGARPLDLILEPGQFYFGEAHLRIGTLLGSCVAITLWNPRTRVGGMCHYLLPSRGGGVRRADGQTLDGRYGDEALRMFMREIDRAGTAPSDYEAKVFGGGNQFPDHNSARPIDVPTRNIDAALRLMAGHGLHLTAQDVGGSGARQVVLDLATGHVWVRHRRILKLESSK